MVAGQGVGEDRRAGHGAIEVFGLDDDVVHGAAHAVDLAGDDLDPGAVGQGGFRDVGGGQAAVAGRHHLQGGREVGPELEAVHGAVGVALGHLLVDDAGAGRHPLHVAA